jgi:hypothetical protein
MRSIRHRESDTDHHVKGTLLQGVVAGMRALCAEDESARSAADSRLSREARRLVDEEIIGVRWYPVESYGELVDLFWELAGHRDPAFMREAGRAGGRAMIESGIYRSYVETSRRPTGDPVERAIRGARVAVGITRMLYDFVEVDVSYDEDRDVLELTYRGVSPLPDALLLGTQGFLDAFAAEVGTLGDDTPANEIPWHAERPSRDEFLFRLPLEGLRSRA